MVSSGAIAEGMKRLGWSVRPKAIHELQAAAAVGQMGLVQMYETKLRENGIGSAQVLLTHADLADRERYLNARSTLLTSQLPVSSWHAQIGDPTIADSTLDRLVHNAHRLELDGHSMRRSASPSEKVDEGQRA